MHPMELLLGFLWMTSQIPHIFVQGSSSTIRLVGGSHAREGRVEIYENGQWGSVCDDNWDEDDAMVACRQLGFGTTNVRAYGVAHFGQSTLGRIWLDEVQCFGTESRLTDCLSTTLGVHNCGHSEDAGVSCDLGGVDIRLVGGSNFWEGRVEVRFSGQWGTVCDDGWTDDDAQVACRQLGFQSVSAATAYSMATYGQGQGPILLDDLGCTGTEQSLFMCDARPAGTHNCGHSEDAGVDCGVQPVTTTTTACSSCDSNTTSNAMPNARLYTIIYISVGVGVPVFIMIVAVIFCKCCNNGQRGRRVAVDPYDRAWSPPPRDDYHGRSRFVRHM